MFIYNYDKANKFPSADIRNRVELSSLTKEELDYVISFIIINFFIERINDYIIDSRIALKRSEKNGSSMPKILIDKEVFDLTHQEDLISIISKCESNQLELKNLKENLLNLRNDEFNFKKIYECTKSLDELNSKDKKSYRLTFEWRITKLFIHILHLNDDILTKKKYSERKYLIRNFNYNEYLNDFLTACFKKNTYLGHFLDIHDFKAIEDFRRMLNKKMQSFNTTTISKNNKAKKNFKFKHPSRFRKIIKKLLGPNTKPSKSLRKSS